MLENECSETGDRSKRIGVVGLGLMGTALTLRLLEHGYLPFVWNRTRAKGDGLISRGANWSENPFVECERVLLSLWSSDVVADVLRTMEGGFRSGQVIIDTTTGDPASSFRLGRRLSELGLHYLDAPISGSSEQTRQGTATVIVGGDREVFEGCRELWAVLGQKTFYAGPSGSASKMKLVSNLVLGLNRAALAEGLVFAERLGIDLNSALEVLKGSAAYSRQMDTKGQKMVDGEFSVQAKLAQHLKDVRLILESARDGGFSLPLSETHEHILEQGVEAGLGEADNSAIIKAIRAMQHVQRDQRLSNRSR